MSSMKGGFSTLNRWFGRKKDKTSVGGAAANGKLSKSTTQLHHMSTDQGMHINEASQLDYNRITPLPAATSNAPFEQTFRITVLLPKDQLYVTRLGARVPLSKLLSLVCDNKQLDADKYEFRNTVDASQVYSCESTIGAVGLSEIRLCHKSESYDSFNADSMLKFQRTGAARDSLSSSSDFSSSRHSHSHSNSHSHSHSKLTAKTPSPYSSSNSLNSMDSTGMNYTRTPVVPPKALALAPPPRKKRIAPRPPSQLVIPEQSVAQFNSTPRTTIAEPAYAVIVKRPQLCMSTPNLASTPELDMEMETPLEMAAEMEAEPMLELDCNGNSAKTPDASDGGHYATLELKQNGNGNANGNGNGNANAIALPEPTPRKRLLQLKKKAAPAPPPDATTIGGGAASADSISLASITASNADIVPTTPQPAPRITTPIPTSASPTSATATINPQLTNGNQNVSKVLLNRTPTPEPRSLGSATEEEDNNDAASKQADSGIGEPLPSPLPSSSSSPEPEPEPEMEAETEKVTETEPEEKLQMVSKSQTERKSHIESSSDDEEAIKVYNFKTSSQSSHKVKELSASATLTELTVLTAQQTEMETETETETETEDEEKPSPVNGALGTPSSASELTSLSSWSYAGPISPPADFSDGSAPIVKSKVSAGSPLDEIVDELSSIIQQQRLDTLIRQPPEQAQIEAAKPNRLANFSIAAIGNGNGNGNVNGLRNGSDSGHSSPSITRADSFQAVGQSPRHSRNSLGLTLGASQRLCSTSQLSLNRCEPTINGSGSGSLQQRRSSSELSIGESPSLQSLELIKTILGNSRKNSLADSTDAAQQQSEKPKSSPSPAGEPNTLTANLVLHPSTVESAQTAVVTVESSPASVATVASTVASTAAPVRTVVETTAATVVSPGTVMSTTIGAPVPAAEPVAAVAPVQDKTIVSGAVEPEAVAKPLPVAPTYRYSGPPSINFATWSERPKSQVAIKNEGDYIYGGAQARRPAKLTIEVASPVLRMGIPRKEYHVPITVKPLRDGSQEREREPQQSKTQLRPETEPEPEPEPVTEPATDRLRESNKPTTLPRPAKCNRFTLPAGAIAIDIAGPSSSASNSLPRPSSMLEKQTTPTESAAAPATAPFGQNTLRRTGFKERMLAKEQQEKEQALRMRVSVNGMATPTATSTLLRSSKVELQVKLRPTSLMAIRTPIAATPAATPSPTSPPSAPPAPPAPAMLTKLKPAQRGANVVTPTTPDPRDQLLEAIRSFKREKLSRA